jgi:hypothetical protein
VEEVGKGHGRVNIVQILCTHVCKWKNDAYLLKLFQELGGQRKMKENGGGGEFKYDIFGIL